MTAVDDLLVTLLIDLVEQVPDTPKRILFKGVSDLYAAFRARSSIEHPLWDVRETTAGSDVIGARNDPTIPVLVVFYRAEVRERESLNAFRLFNEDQIAKELLTRLASDRLLSGLSQAYSDDERERLTALLDMVYPSVRRLAQFLLAGKVSIGQSLPLLGLFRDPGFHLGMAARQWGAQLRENQQAAVLRWRDFLRKGTGTKAGRQVLGEGRLALVRAAETDPSRREEVLSEVMLREALSILNPPTRLVERIMGSGYTREQAERLVRAVKTGEAGYAGSLNLDHWTEGMPSLSDRVRSELERNAPQDDDDEGDDAAVDMTDLRRVGFCLEGLLRLARQEGAFPANLEIRRTDVDNEYQAVISVDEAGHLQVQMTSEAARFLSAPSASGVSELQYEVYLPNQSRFRFTLGVMPHWLEQFAEDWLDEDEDYWDMVRQLSPEYADKWDVLHQAVTALRDVVDPDWKHEPSDEEEQDDFDREPNNPIYAIFDLLYFVHRDLFDNFLDAWLTVAKLPWRAKVAQKPQEWREAIAGLLRLGASRRTNGWTVLFPFFPLRLVWYREVLMQIESWLCQAARTQTPLVFEPAVLAEQLQPVDRPRALFRQKERLVEAASDTFFIARFVTEDQNQRASAPLYRARQKLQQFGRMWPFSLARLHLAFQPGEAGEDIYRMLVQESDQQPDAAYQVRALVDSTGAVTYFDNQLLSTSEETVDLLTEEHFESLLPRVDYAKERLAHDEDEYPLEDTPPSDAHITLLVDAFGEDTYDFGEVVGRLNKNPEWAEFTRLVQDDSEAARDSLLRVDISAPPYHTGPVQENRRDLVFIPFSGDHPEYLRILYDSLVAWQYCGAFNEGVYFERVRWDADRLNQLHDQADWVLLFDRMLDKSLFDTLTPTGVRLIDYYGNLRGGYKMSVSSRRAEAVEWQLAQVLQQFFTSEELDAHQVAQDMLERLSTFASGLLLKTLGGGSLAQELLGLYATYLSLINEGEYVPGQDWLIPLDDFQSWFGRRTRRGRRADLMVLRNPSPDVLCMVAVESKWYRQSIGRGFVRDEFGEDGQMRTTVSSLRSLFDPMQGRIDKHYWQKTLASLLDAAPSGWDSFCGLLGSDQWSLEIDGVVYVHQYVEEDSQRLADRNAQLNTEVEEQLSFPADLPLFHSGPSEDRLRIKGREQIVRLFKQGLQDPASASSAR